MSPSGVSDVYAPRRVCHIASAGDAEGVKLYGIAVSTAAVDAGAFWPQFEQMKASEHIHWPQTAAFAIFHEGAEQLYLVLCWWGNGNELFVRVAVRERGGWVMDPSRYSFCLWDMEIMWHERASYIRWVYSGPPDLAAYRGDLAARTN